MRAIPVPRRARHAALFGALPMVLGAVLLWACAGSAADLQALGTNAGLPAPSSMPLADYERKVLLPWLGQRTYASLGWARDAKVRDTGPLVNRQYYGTHPAVRIYYSPQVTAWLENREGELPNGSIIVKEMFHPPAELYQEIATDAYFAANTGMLESLLAKLLSGWSVMIKDRGGNSKDGWFWAALGAQAEQTEEEWLAANVDDNAHVRYAGFGLGTCIRCHASAEKENTFSSLNNIGPPFSNEPALRFHIDDSWRTKDYWGEAPNAYDKLDEFFDANEVPESTRTVLKRKFNLVEQSRPWRARNRSGDKRFANMHSPPRQDNGAGVGPEQNKTFVASFPYTLNAGVDEFTLPMQWADHVYPGPETDGGVNRHDEFITANNCLGCHGGLGGTPSGLSMFVKTGPAYGDGFNVSEFGEWRWSPMGLAGRDPIFHAQLESELILLLENGGKLAGTTADPRNPLHGTVAENQKALINTCLSCHGAMGQRQLAIDTEAARKLPSGAALQRDFDPDFFYLTEALSERDLRVAEARNKLSSPPRPTRPVPNPAYSYENPGDFYNHHRYGELARGGISCAICHRIVAPGSTQAGVKRRDDFFALARGENNWLPQNDSRLWLDNFIYFLAANTTGQFERGPADQLYGPFDDVIDKPMRNAMGITPMLSAPMDSRLNKGAQPQTPFISDSNMCGTCHTINLPNIGAAVDEFPVLTKLEHNPTLRPYAHSIEQATYLEWLNSAFGPGKNNERGAQFKSCQDCHMPNSFKLPTGESIDPLVSQIASIQDSSYPAADHALPGEQLAVPLRSDYRRHELVGLNVFVVAMARQFPGIIGVALQDYETSAVTGAQLSMRSMIESAREDRVVTLDVGAPRIADGKLTTEVTVINQTGHRFPSGVSFRRAFLEFLVLDKDGHTLWGSGQSNAAGLITDGERVLATEFLDRKVRPGDAIAQYQPHYEVISEPTQVQIYEELITDADGAFTTSFIHRVQHIKDNRLLPRGWIDAASFAEYDAKTKIARQGQVLYEFMRATDPQGASVVGGTDANGRLFAADPQYAKSPSDGADRLTYAIPLEVISRRPHSVRVTLYSQALMPAWLHQRLQTAARAKKAGLATPETDRLYYLASRLQFDDEDLPEFAGWKLRIKSQARTIRH